MKKWWRVHFKKKKNARHVVTGKYNSFYYCISTSLHTSLKSGKPAVVFLIFFVLFYGILTIRAHLMSRWRNCQIIAQPQWWTSLVSKFRSTIVLYHLLTDWLTFFKFFQISSELFPYLPWEFSRLTPSWRFHNRALGSLVVGGSWYLTLVLKLDEIYRMKTVSNIHKNFSHDFNAI